MVPGCGLVRIWMRLPSGSSMVRRFMTSRPELTPSRSLAARVLSVRCSATSRRRGSGLARSLRAVVTSCGDRRLLLAFTLLCEVFFAAGFRCADEGEAFGFC